MEELHIRTHGDFPSPPVHPDEVVRQFQKLQGSGTPRHFI